jgi:methionyl-tRNA formyltransferase
VTSLRLVFAGSPTAAVPSLDALIASRHEIAAVVSREDSPVGRRRTMTPTPVSARAADAGLERILADRLTPEVGERIAALQPDLGVIVAYGGLVREPLLSAPRLGWINLHFSLLPRWRGAAPVQHAILAGDEVTGVNVFQLVPQLDAGPVFAERVEPIGRFQTSGGLLERLADLGAQTLVEVVDALADGTAVAVEQNGAPTLAPKLSASDGVIDWHQEALMIDRRIRAVTPEPGASTMLLGERFKVISAAVSTDGPPRAPGAVDAVDGRIYVGTADAPLELLRVQPAGRTTMDAAAWWRGRPAGIATVFG